MLWSLTALLLVAAMAVGFIRDGYAEHPVWKWAGQGRPISLRTRWVSGFYFVLCALLFVPGIERQVPKSLPAIVLVGIVPLGAVMALMDSMSGKRRWLRGKRRSALSREEQQELRRQRKKERTRRAQARHNS